MTNGADSLRKRFSKRPFGRAAPSRTRATRRAEAPHLELAGAIRASLLRFEQQRVGNRVVLAAVGEVDVTSTADLRRALEAARDAGATEIWLDLTETTFMDGSGLRVLLALRAELLAANRRLVLICPPGPVLRLLVLTAADREFEIYPTRTAAQHGT